MILTLVGRDNKCLNHLKYLSAKSCSESVVLLYPFPFEKTVPTFARYDIGLVLIEPASLKLKYTLPKKLFESIIAGLCVVAGPLPDMKKIIKKSHCGFVTDLFRIERIAEAINFLTLKDIMEKKKTSLKAAKVLNAEKEMKKFNAMIYNLIGN